ncbi:MAG: cadherin-like domain-containing protein [Hormoscilla sp. GM7CHS1pb]|nr:cadherin-like domain-containing protein [Hormoscilla sp. GM7CHS1pb]
MWYPYYHGYGGYRGGKINVTYIDLSNFSPTDLDLSNNSIDENVAPNTVVGTFSTTDPTLSTSIYPDTGDTFTYQLVAGTGDTDNSAFTIDGDQLRINSSPDFETQSSYSILVQTTDAGGLSYSENLTININDVNEVPTDLSLSNNSIDENVAPNTVVGTFSTTDPDTGDSFTYQLVPGAGDTDNAAFTIVEDQLQINSSPDFETQSSYSILVQTTDAGGESYSENLTININDVNEVPTDLSLSNNSIDENVAPNTVVGTFSTTDPDTGDSFTYQLVAGAGDTDNAAFTIVEDQLLINSSPDFEAQSSYSILVQTTDAGGESYSENLTININDVNENSPPVAMDDSITTLEQTAVTLDVLANDTDPDGNPIQLVGYETATNGTVTHGTPDSPGKDLLIYTPNSGFTGNDSITYTISDGNAAFDTAEVNITVNSAPEEVIQLKITPSEPVKAVEPNTSVSFDVNYSTEPAETPTTGIAFHMHWDSSQVAFDPVTGLTEHFPLGAQPISAVLDDPIANGGLDGDPNTDKYILQAWVDANGNWPNNPNPTLYTANFTALPGFSGTQINFGANSDDLPANSNFVPSSIALTSRAPSPTLDIDGNGVIDALTDGLVAIRYLFGFRGETLTKDVVGEGATSDTSEIVTYLDEVGDMMLDIDGNGTAGALTDGILFLRHALGFSDQALIQGAISEGATRTTATAINEHMQSFSGVVSEGATDPGILDPFSDTQSNDSFYDSFYSFEVL